MHLGKHVGQRLNSCTLLDDACTYFDSLLERNVYLWNTIIGVHAKHGRNMQAVQLFQQMQQESTIPDNVTIIHMLSSYTKLDLFAEGKRLHSCLLQDTIESDVVMGTALLTMYGRHGRVGLAEGVFCQSKEQDVTLWNAMMNIYAQHGQDSNVLRSFYQMHLTDLDPDKVTYACVLGVCARLPDLENGRIIHTCIVCRKLECDPMVATTLVSMYGKCSSLDDAERLFDKLAIREVATWNTLIAAFVAHEKEKQALYVFYQMHMEGVIAVKATFVSILGALSGEAAVAEGKRMHAHIAACGFLSDKVVTTALFGMYGSCASMEDAEDLFEGMAERTKISWNAMLSKHLQNKCGEKAFWLFDRMLWEGQAPDMVTYLNMILACNLEETFLGATVMHLHIKSSNYESEVAVATALVVMYAKLGNLERAKRLFDNIHDRNMISWNSMMRTYAQCSLSNDVFQLLEQLKQEGFMPNDATFTLSLSVCCSEAEVVKGKQVHACIGFQKLETQPLLLSALANMYAMCGSLQDALTLSKSIVEKDICIWNNLIEACAQRGLETMAFLLLDQMRHEGVIPNCFTFIGILGMCSSVSNVERCRKLHAYIVHGDFKEDASVASALVKAYGMCGNLVQARTIFDYISNKDAILWNTMLSVYTRHVDHVLSILQLHAQMHQEGQLPTSITYVSFFSACASSDLLHEAMRLHSCIRHTNLVLDISLMNSLIFMYGKCGRHEISYRLLFEMPKRDKVSWSGMISVYAEIGDSRKALQLFYQMVGQEEILPDTSTIISTLSACACSALLIEGKVLHSYIAFLKLDADAEVANSLINMYGKCGDLEDALVLFTNLSKKDTCSWNTMLASLLYHSHDTGAIQLFKQMQQEEVDACDITYASVLSACGNVASLICGRQLHHIIACSEGGSVMTVANAIISMYGKCGSLEDALRQFAKLFSRNTISWNAMIAAHAHHGCGEEAIELLNSMEAARSPPDEISFLTTVLACSHSGLVDIGCHLWVSMCQDLKIKPESEHFSCLVDAFSRAGRLFDAKQFMVNMPFQPCSAAWTALLSACRDHVNVAQGLEVADYLLELDPLEFPTHIMLSNIRVVASRVSSLN